MPMQELSHRPHWAVLWAATGKYDRFGQPVVSATPVELRVRWNDVFKQIVDPKGNIITVDAQVVVDRDVPVGSVMWRGRLSDFDSKDYRAVVGFNGTSDLKGRGTFREAFLTRLGNYQMKQE